MSQEWNKIILDHPSMFMEGTRVITLTSRNKDDAIRKRTIVRVSHKPDHFKSAMLDLTSLLDFGERIYVTAAARDIRKASFVFRDKQLKAEVGTHPDSFYTNIESYWASSLQDVKSVGKNKVWMFDCDSPEDYEFVQPLLQRFASNFLYEYPTKNGHHVMFNPFNMGKMDERTKNMIHRNPVMLWAWTSVK